MIYHVTDLAKAKAWYNRVLEQEPYFDQPFYAGYSVGGFELGLVPDGMPGREARLPIGQCRTPPLHSSGWRHWVQQSGSSYRMSV